jgi:hypothetical protein
LNEETCLRISVDPTDLLRAIQECKDSLEKVKMEIFTMMVAFGNLNDELKKFESHVKVEKFL